MGKNKMKKAADFWDGRSRKIIKVLLLFMSGVPLRLL